MISISPPAGQFGPVRASAPKWAKMVILRTVTPKGWPSTAPGRHVDGVHDDKTPGEVILRLYPDALAVSRDLCGSFDLHDDVSGRIHADESVGLLRAVINHWFDGIWTEGETHRILHAEEIDISCVIIEVKKV